MADMTRVTGLSAACSRKMAEAFEKQWKEDVEAARAEIEEINSQPLPEGVDE